MYKLEGSQIFLVLLLTISYPCETVGLFGITLGDLKAIFDWSYEVYSKMNEAYDSYGTFTAEASLESIISEVSKLAIQIDQLAAKIEQKVDSVMRALLQRLPAMRQRDDAMANLATNLDIIDRFWRDFEVYKENEGGVNDLTLKRWAKSITSHEGGDLPDVLWKIYRLMVPGHDLQDGLLLLISRVTEQSLPEICDTGLSPQHRLHQLYQTVLERQMKGYLMTVFAYTLLGVYEKGNFTVEMKAAEKQFETTAKRFLKVVIASMKGAPRDIRRCDPRSHTRGRINNSFLNSCGDFGIRAEWHFFASYHGEGPCDSVGGILKRAAARASLQLPFDKQISNVRELYKWAVQPNNLPKIEERYSSTTDYERAAESLNVRYSRAKTITGKTFVELERLMQSYIINEVDVSRKGSCDASCGGLPSNAQQFGTYDSGNFHQYRWCTGDLIWCGFGGGQMRACQLPKKEVRRYDWFSDPDGLDGIETNCEDGKMFYFSGWQRGLLECHYCVCTCMQDRVFKDDETVRTIDLRDQMSNIKENMVVTGLRFVEEYKIIHVQILEGPLLPEGQINTKKLKWKRIETFKYEFGTSDKLHWDTFSIIWTNKDGVNITSQMRYGRDYGGIRRDQRDMQLDDILLPDDYVVTGVRFKHPRVMNKPWEYQPIRFEVHGTPFDYGSGLLVPTEEKPSMWFNSDNMPNRPDKYYGRKRREIRLTYPGNPINYQEHLPNSEPNTYIKFTGTDRRKDGGQSTVPFFDALQVGGKNGFPLSGVGLFHRGYSTSGGFLAFRIYALDLTNYMTLPEDDDDSADSEIEQGTKSPDYETDYY